MTDQPLVSIIIPTYNRAHLIEETLDSVLAQTYENWECIVVDDGSTDATALTVEAYLRKDARFQFFKRPNHKPKGANACRNYGFEKSKGEFIQWFDSDDLMHPRKLDLKICYALKEKATVVVDTFTLKANGVLDTNPKVVIFESDVFHIDYILGKKPVITNDVMVKRSIVGKLRFDEQLHKAQEFEFFSRLFAQPLKYCFVDLPLTQYREGHDSISKNTSKGNPAQVESLIYLSKILQQRYPDHPQIVASAERQGRKTYKSLAIRGNLKMILKHFQFFRKVHHKSVSAFFLFMWYNLLTKKGFDRMKPKEIIS
jgi:glycosyltransferase involved in cell wall biosynthesis